MAEGGGASGAAPLFCSPEDQPAYASRPGGWTVQTATDVGGRPRQEDKFYVQQAVALAGGAELAFFGVWDGTVCPHASEHVHTRCCDHHLWCCAGVGGRTRPKLVGAPTNIDPRAQLRQLSMRTHQPLRARAV